MGDMRSQRCFPTKTGLDEPISICGFSVKKFLCCFSTNCPLARCDTRFVSRRMSTASLTARPPSLSYRAAVSRDGLPPRGAPRLSVARNSTSAAAIGSVPSNVTIPHSHAEASLPAGAAAVPLAFVQNAAERVFVQHPRLFRFGHRGLTSMRHPQLPWIVRQFMDSPAAAVVASPGDATTIAPGAPPPATPNTKAQGAPTRQNNSGGGPRGGLGPSLNDRILDGTSEAREAGKLEAERWVHVGDMADTVTFEADMVARRQSILDSVALKRVLEDSWCQAGGTPTQGIPWATYRKVHAAALAGILQPFMISFSPPVAAGPNAAAASSPSPSRAANGGRMSVVPPPAGTTSPRAVAPAGRSTATPVAAGGTSSSLRGETGVFYPYRIIDGAAAELLLRGIEADFHFDVSANTALVPAAGGNAGHHAPPLSAQDGVGGGGGLQASHSFPGRAHHFGSTGALRQEGIDTATSSIVTTPSVSYAIWCLSLVELADNWVDRCEGERYAAFLEKLLAPVFAEIRAEWQEQRRRLHSAHAKPTVGTEAEADPEAWGTVVAFLKEEAFTAKNMPLIASKRNPLLSQVVHYYPKHV
mgnify:CR=1 FL=1